MFSQNLANAIIKEMKPDEKVKNCNLNFKIEGQDYDKFDKISQILGKSKTELAKFIIVNSLDDLLEQVNKLNTENKNKSFELTDEIIINLARTLIDKLPSGFKFELKDLFGGDWDKLGDSGNKNKYGKLFRKLIDSGQIENVKFICIQNNRHALYEKV